MANVYVNRAWMLTATAGTGTMTLSTAKPGYMTLAEAGVANADTVDYVIVDGNNFEIGVGTYTSAGTLLSRDTVEVSKISGTVGTTKLTLSGTAEVFIAPSANDSVFIDRNNVFTSDQYFGNSAGISTVFFDGPTGNTRSFFFRTAGSNRWQVSADNSTETGSNVGSNFDINRYDDTGAYVDTPFTIIRGTGLARINLDPGSKFGSDTTTGAFVVVNGASGAQKMFNLQTTSLNRWLVGTDNAAESGSDAGANFAIYSYTDAGAFKETVLGINRATGVTNIKSLTLTTDLAVIYGGTGASDAATAATNLGLGTTDTVQFQMLNLYSNTDFQPQATIRHAGATAGSGPYFIMDRARGTIASPTIVSSADTVGQLLWRAYDGTAYRSTAMIAVTVGTAPGASDMPGRMSFQTTPDGTITLTERLVIEPDGSVIIVSNDLEIGNVDTTISRTAAGVIAVEGINVLLAGKTDVISKGFTVAPNNIGNMGTTGFTVNPTLGNYQYCTRDGTSGTPTITAPSSDCAVDILLTNAAAGTLVAITFSGFTVGAGLGGTISTTLNARFLISIRRINSISTYSIYALQ